VKDNHRLYSGTVSFPLVSNEKDYKGAVPSIDLQRSVGTDLLQGREYRAETRIMLSVKY